MIANNNSCSFLRIEDISIEEVVQAKWRGSICMGDKKSCSNVGQGSLEDSIYLSFMWQMCKLLDGFSGGRNVRVLIVKWSFEKSNFVCERSDDRGVVLNSDHVQAQLYSSVVPSFKGACFTCSYEKGRRGLGWCNSGFQNHPLSSLRRRDGQYRSRPAY